jgi:predicted Fe-Mo cluster-binding NifX family protein
MAKIGMTVLRDDDASELSPHFGLAKWVLVMDEETGTLQRFRNVGLTGEAVVRLMVEHGCSEAIFTSIGDQALLHLRDAGIVGWYGPSGEPAAALAKRLRENVLRRAEQASHEAPRRHRRAERG